jgi:hypothetical protein
VLSLYVRRILNYYLTGQQYENVYKSKIYFLSVILYQYKQEPAFVFVLHVSSMVGEVENFYISLF